MIKCTKVKEHIRDGSKVTQYVRCSNIQNKSIAIEDIKNDAEKIFNENELDYFYSGESTSNGISVYYKVKLKSQSDDFYQKLRISDHSVTNINRLSDEIHLNSNISKWSDYDVGRIMGKLGSDKYEYKKGDVKMPSGKIVQGFAYFKK
jgi:hypothetical protein